MLKGISSKISPKLLKVLCEMGHGEEIVFGDGNFPSGTCATNHLVRCDGLTVTELLDAILPLFPLDTNEEYYAYVMQTNDGSVPEIYGIYENIISEHGLNQPFKKLARQDFYDRARKAYCVVTTSEAALFANIIIRKGCVFHD